MALPFTLPFTVEQFHGVFRDYNTAVWPAQWLLVALAIVPLLWCLVGAQAAFLLGVQPDLGLIAAAVVGMGLLVTAGQRPRTSKP